MTKYKGYTSMIDNTICISESEIVKLEPEYLANWYDKKLTKLKGVLFTLGMDTNQNFEVQSVTQHRNRFNEVVTCARYIGKEREDYIWLTSGMASTTALDKSKNSHLLDDIYRSRALTIDVQQWLERKDKYQETEENEE